MTQQEADRIIAAVCAEFGIEVADLRSSRKQGRVTQAREVCCYLVQGLNDDDVARMVGVHRTSVLKCRRRVEQKLKDAQSRFKRQIRKIRGAAKAEVAV